MEITLNPPLPKLTPKLTLSAALTPWNSLAAYPSSSSTSPSTAKSKRQVVYLAEYGDQRYESRQFIIKTFTLFASLQQIALKAAEQSQNFYKPNALAEEASEESVRYYHRVSKLYREAVVEQFAVLENDKDLSPKKKAKAIEHHAVLHGILQLAEIVYLPADGKGYGVVGEEILDWVNVVDRAPSAAEGEELAELARPWEHPNCWNYIFRCVLRGHLLSASALLSAFSTHPSASVQEAAAAAVQLINTRPRSTKFREERTFLASVRKWKFDSRAALDEHGDDFWAEAGEEDYFVNQDDDEVRLGFASDFSFLFDLLDGNQERIVMGSEDWREALGAWGLWVNPGGRREDLAETLNLILKDRPVDSTLPPDVVQASLVQGDIPKVLQQANLISHWLVAHLADIFEKLIPSATAAPPQAAPLAITLRDHFVLSYADSLMSDPGLWRITVDYMSTCGPLGRARMGKVLESVNLEVQPEKEKAMEVDNGEEEEVLPTVVEEVLSACAEYDLHEETRRICKIYSEHLVSQKQYGMAVSFCVRADDSKRIARIADRILNEYIDNGYEAFYHHVDSIPTSLLRPPTSGDDSSMEDDEDDDRPLRTPYSARLSFLARYRDFHAYYGQGERRRAAALLVLLMSSEVAPKRFYGVMFLDVLMLLENQDVLVTQEETFELLRCLEEITAPVITAGGKDIYGYLEPLAKITLREGKDDRDGTLKALARLKIVRSALARHLGRCFSL